MTVLKTYMKLLVKNSYAVLPFFVIFMVCPFLLVKVSAEVRHKYFRRHGWMLSFPLLPKMPSERLCYGSRVRVTPTHTMMTEKAREEIFLSAFAAYLFSDTETELPVVLADQSRAPLLCRRDGGDVFRFAMRIARRRYDRSRSLFEVLSQEMKVEIDAPEDTDGTESGVATVVGSMSGAAYVLLAVSLSVLPLVNEAFTRPGVFERSVTAPYKVNKRVFELYLGSGIVVFVSAAALFGLSFITMYHYITPSHLGRVAVNYLAYVLCVLAIGNIVSNLTRNRAAISAISTVFSLGLSFVSGAFVPQEL